MTAALFRLAAPGSRALERMGLFVGKIIYYLDAAEDYEKDTRNGAYNVFALQGLSKAEAVAEAQRLCRMCAGEAALAYNLLEPGPCKAILDNICLSRPAAEHRIGRAKAHAAQARRIKLCAERDASPAPCGGNIQPDIRQQKGIQMDAYKVLGLTEGATEEEIKTAYRALAQKYNPDNYEAGPLREEAEAKMTELNEAFDALMGAIRTGTPVNSRRAANAGEPEPDTGAAANGRYRAIRQMINSGAVEQALAELNAIQGGANDAEWNFLVGSAYYYKGWVADALRYFQTACRLAPGNREYEAALRNLQNSAGGAMPGNPYGNNGMAGAQAVGCSCCDMCTAMMCMDMCCGCGRGGC